VAPKVHRSVFERIARNTEGYAPGSLPADAEVVSQSQSTAMTTAVRALVRGHHGSTSSLLEREARLQRLGRWSYWLFVWGVLITGLLTGRAYVLGALEGAQNWRDVVHNVADTLISSQWIGLLLQTLWRHPWLVAWLALTLALALWVDRQLDRRYSEFWHDMRLKLRKTLGLG
jgi:hypothetical protein